MREGWKYKKLKDVASLITDGDWIESRHQSESGIRLIQTGNVGNGIFKAKDDKPHYISEDTFLELGCTEIFRGDCLVSRLPEPVGRACIIPDVGCRMITAVDCTIIRFKDCILPKLFVYYTRSKQYKREIDNSTTGTTRKRISRKNLESVSIPLLPVDEQNKIVAELDLLTEIIDKQKQQLKELDTLAQSIFYDMFGSPVENDKNWNINRLGGVLKTTSGGTPSKSHSEYYEGGTIPWVNSGDLHQMYIYSVQKFITQEGVDNSSAKLFPINSVLIAMYGATVGEVSILKIESTTNQAVCCIFPNDAYDSIFLYSVMKNSKHYFVDKASGGAQSNISQGVIKDFLLITPPIELQKSFAKKIQSIESQKQSINRSIAESQKLFDYTMDKYFG